MYTENTTTSISTIACLISTVVSKIWTAKPKFLSTKAYLSKTKRQKLQSSQIVQGFIARNFKYQNYEMTLALKSDVRPHLEYASPHLRRHIV